MQVIYIIYMYTLDQIKNNILTFKNKLSTKNITKGFWIIADREDFTPLRKIIIKNNKENKTTEHTKCIIL